MRDNKVIISFNEKLLKKKKEMELVKHLKKEVDTGANGTQKYVIKKGTNKGKVAEWKIISG